jgi:hypothetical protein|tara:strand:+ start:309 stop:1016 length:708 start_codon:yes stop_codon:yes gene_type:complete
MAVNVNTVYQRVLAITNKEQRGYITPQEFNTIANQAQLDIFEQYFYDLNQFGRIPGNQTDYSDMLDILEEKISIFEKINVSVSGGTTLPADLYRLGSILTNCPTCREAEQVTQKEWLYIQKSPIAQPSDEFPVYIRDNAGIKVYGNVNTSTNLPTQITNGVYVNYVKIPATVSWVANSTTGLYLSNNSVDFELHESEETELVNKILALAGILLKDGNLYQTGSAEEMKNVQQEKA